MGNNVALKAKHMIITANSSQQNCARLPALFGQNINKSNALAGALKQRSRVGPKKWVYNRSLNLWADYPLTK